MELHQVAELAALVSAHSGQLIEASVPVPDAPLHAYWEASGARLTGWMRRLGRPEAEPDARSQTSARADWEQTESLLEEIFVSELLTRIWAAVLTAHDQRRQICHAEPIVRQVFVGHLQARRAAMSLLASGPDVALAQLANVDRLRRRTERWTDLLLGHLLCRYDVGEFAFNTHRAIDFGEEQQSAEDLPGPLNSWDFILAGLRLAFPRSHSSNREGHAAEHAIIGSVLASFPPDSFSADGPFRSRLLTRIARSGLHPEGPPAAGFPCSQSPPTELRTGAARANVKGI